MSHLRPSSAYLYILMACDKDVDAYVILSIQCYVYVRYTRIKFFFIPSPPSPLFLLSLFVMWHVMCWFNDENSSWMRWMSIQVETWVNAHMILKAQQQHRVIVRKKWRIEKMRREEEKEEKNENLLLHRLFLCGTHVHYKLRWKFYSIWSNRKGIEWITVRILTCIVHEWAYTLEWETKQSHSNAGESEATGQRQFSSRLQHWESQERRKKINNTKIQKQSSIKWIFPVE